MYVHCVVPWGPVLQPVVSRSFWLREFIRPSSTNSRPDTGRLIAAKRRHEESCVPARRSSDAAGAECANLPCVCAATSPDDAARKPKRDRLANRLPPRAVVSRLTTQTGRRSPLARWRAGIDIVEKSGLVIENRRGKCADVLRPLKQCARSASMRLSTSTRLRAAISDQGSMSDAAFRGIAYLHASPPPQSARRQFLRNRVMHQHPGSIAQPCLRDWKDGKACESAISRGWHRHARSLRIFRPTPAPNL